MDNKHLHKYLAYMFTAIIFLGLFMKFSFIETPTWLTYAMFGFIAFVIILILPEAIQTHKLLKDDSHKVKEHRRKHNLNMMKFAHRHFFLIILAALVFMYVAYTRLNIASSTVSFLIIAGFIIFILSMGWVIYTARHYIHEAPHKRTFHDHAFKKKITKPLILAGIGIILMIVVPFV